MQDLYLERLNPQNKDEYLTPTGSAPFATREEIIRVRFIGEERFTVRATRHGPVLPLDFKPLAKLLPKDHVLAMAWPSLSDEDGTLAAGQALMMAQDCAGFMRAVEDYVAPMQNMVCADVAGHIGFIAPGRVPIRKPENDTLGLLPAPGWKDAYDWTGLIPFDALPQALDPPSGFIATANNRIVPKNYPYLINLEWETDERVRRIEALIEASHEHIGDELRGHANGPSVALRPRDGAADDRRDSKARRPRIREPPKRLRCFAAWDGTMSAERAEPLIFMAWLNALTRALIADELGEELFPLHAGPSKSLIRKLVTGDETVARWCDDKTTAGTETCAEIMSKSFDGALSDLAAEQGPWLSRWRWGKVHEARFTHRLDAFPLFGPSFDRQVPTGGGIDTIDRGQTYFGRDHPLANVHGAGYRAIYDLDDPEASVFIISTGQSGNPLSPYYDNLIEAWADGTYLPMTTRRAAIEEDGARLLRLVPAGPHAKTNS